MTTVHTHLTIISAVNSPRSAEMAALTRLATPPIKYPVTAMRTALAVISAGESEIQ